MEICIRSG